jgi:sterol desaturase/sphingolipid hydroxylase (fatty acid hydroxylase superfamily)
MNEIAAPPIAAATKALALFLLGGGVFTALALIPGQSCNPGRPWWRARGLATDLAYMAMTPLIGPVLRAVSLFGIAALLLSFFSVEQLYDHLQNGRGPLTALPFPWRFAVFFALLDLLLYLTHRLFHTRLLWPFHAVHHSAMDVDWTTGYRMHPVNLLLGVYLSIAVLIFLGAPPLALAIFAPIDAAWSFFVHSNLNWTLGPLRFIVTTPAFHRWHHTAPDRGGETNFAAFFPVWDILFGTFRMPAGERPSDYGVVEPGFPQGFLAQLVHPFRAARRKRG